MNPVSTNHDSRPLTLSDRVRSLRLPDQSAAPRPRTPWLPWLLCLVLAAAAGYLVVTRPEPGPAKPAADDVKSLSSQPAATSAAKAPAAGEVVLEQKGYIQATHPYKVGPNQVGSKVVKLHPRFLEGQYIHKDEILAEIDDTEYRTKYEQAKGDYEQSVKEEEASWWRWVVLETGNRPEEKKQAKADLDEATATLERLELDLERSDKLKVGGAMARRDYEETMFGYRAQKHRVEMLTHKWNLMEEGYRTEQKEEGFANWMKALAIADRARAAMEEAKWRLDNCVIRAPISGTILKKYVELGDPLDARAFNLAAVLCDMTDLRDLEVELTIQEREAARVVKGQECVVHPETYPDKSFKGVVSRKMPNADRSKGAIPVRVKVLDIPNNNQDQYLVPDGGAIVTFLATPPEKCRHNLQRLAEMEEALKSGVNDPKPTPAAATRAPKK